MQTARTNRAEQEQDPQARTRRKREQERRLRLDAGDGGLDFGEGTCRLVGHDRNAELARNL